MPKQASSMGVVGPSNPAGAGVILTFAVLVLLFLYWVFLDVGNLVQVAGDEGYELMKAWMVRQGYDLYTDIWNDQPPLFTSFLAGWYVLFGVNAWVARIASTLAFAILTLVLVRLSPCGGKMLPAGVVVFVLWTSPDVIRLAGAAMLEVPAMALGLSALLPLRTWQRTGDFRSVVLVGALLGLALSVKLTAVLFLPAVFVEVFGACMVMTGSRIMRFLSCALLLCTVSGGVFAAVLFACQGHYAIPLVLSHFRMDGWPLIQENVTRFGAGVLQDHGWPVIWAAIAVVHATVSSSFREIRFHAVLFLTLCIAHAGNVCWWWYYNLHFALPISALCGFAASSFQSAARRITSYAGCSVVRRIATLAGIVCAIGWMLEGRIDSSLGELQLMRHSKRISEDSVVAVLRRLAAEAFWIYCDPIMAFHAGIEMPPELVVAPKKRYWSGAMTTVMRNRILMRYRPEVVVIHEGERDEGLLEWLRGGYSPLAQLDGLQVYLRRDLSVNADKNAVDRRTLKDSPIATVAHQ